MRILRDDAAIAALPEGPLRRLIEQRVAEIGEGGPWDAELFGDIVVVEPGDGADALESLIGWPVLRGLFDDVPFGHEDFAPSFEWVALHPEGFFELVYIVNDDGYGVDIFIADQPGVDPDLLALCRTYAEPAV